MAVDDGYTVALLHMDGSDASTTFTDESGKTWTARDNAQIDTAQKVFGTASGLFDGTTDWIDTPDHADFYFDGDFTIDFRVRFNTLPANPNAVVFFSQFEGAGRYQELYIKNNAGTYEFKWLQIYDAVTISTSQDFTVATNTWYHFALVRNGNNYLHYLDGTSQGTTVDADTSNNIASLAYIGQFNGGSYFDGWIDEFRISKGIARWTANFTPPTEQYSSFIPKVSIF